MVDTFATQDLIAELRGYYPLMPKRRPGGITIQEYEKSEGIAYATARRRLEKLVDAGKYTREENMCDDGLKRWVYYKKL